jgi:hypothetical protein
VLVTRVKNLKDRVPGVMSQLGNEGRLGKKNDKIEKPFSILGMDKW